MTRVLFFDGYCSLCNGLVDWVARHDTRRRVHFASLQGETAARYFPSQKGALDFDTVLYHRDGVVLDRSTAVLTLVSDLGGLWSLAKLGLLVPKFLRNAAYVWVAKNRYRVFGKRDTCRIPTAEEKSLFLP